MNKLFDKEKFKQLSREGYAIFQKLTPELSKEQKDTLMLNAEKIYLKIIEINPCSADAYYHLGLIFGHFKDFDKSAKYFEKASFYNPSKKETYDNIVKSYYYKKPKQENWQLRSKNSKMESIIENELPLEETEPTEEEIMTLEELEELEKFKDKNNYILPLSESEKNIASKETEAIIENISNIILPLETKKRKIID